mmetsp:Transcript_25351/g.68624  ORF Transcript_25351/g.68624 Transcript_25351/m.68624 type:complete len:249 (+) Transcript_25351:104-850(+)
MAQSKAAPGTSWMTTALTALTKQLRLSDCKEVVPPSISGRPITPATLRPAPVPPCAALECVLEDADLLFSIILALDDARSLAVCARVCREWRLYAEADCIWVRLCRERWQGKHVPWSKLAGLASWRMRYCEAERLARVKTLTTEEIQTLVFIFSLNGMSVRFRCLPTGEQVVLTDWSPLLRWGWNQDGTLQVEHYPRHTCERQDNWSWRTFNEHVHLQSRAEEPPENLGAQLEAPHSLPHPAATVRMM